MDPSLLKYDPAHPPSGRNFIRKEVCLGKRKCSYCGKVQLKGDQTLKAFGLNICYPCFLMGVSNILGPGALDPELEKRIVLWKI